MSADPVRPSPMIGQTTGRRATLREFTHVCLDCGALGVAGGYHDHGAGNAGETIALTELPGLIRSFQAVESDKWDIEAERDAYRAALERIATHPASVPYPEKWTHWSAIAREALA